MESMMECSVNYALEKLSARPDLEIFVRDFHSPSTGFMYSDDPRTTEVKNITDDGSHSGASMGCMLRQCQDRLRIRDGITSNNQQDTDSVKDVGEVLASEITVVAKDTESKEYPKNFLEEDKIFSNLVNKFEDGMDDPNKKIANISKIDGINAAVKTMFTGEDRRQLSYGEMRTRYG